MESSSSSLCNKQLQHHGTKHLSNTTTTSEQQWNNQMLILNNIKHFVQCFILFHVVYCYLILFTYCFMLLFVVVIFSENKFFMTSRLICSQPPHRLSTRLWLKIFVFNGQEVHSFRFQLLHHFNQNMPHTHTHTRDWQEQQHRKVKLWQTLRDSNTLYACVKKQMFFLFFSFSLNKKFTQTLTALSRLNQ